VLHDPLLVSPGWPSRRNVLAARARQKDAPRDPGLERGPGPAAQRPPPFGDPRRRARTSGRSGCPDRPPAPPRPVGTVDLPVRVRGDSPVARYRRRRGLSARFTATRNAAARVCDRQRAARHGRLPALRHGRALPENPGWRRDPARDAERVRSLEPALRWPLAIEHPRIPLALRAHTPPPGRSAGDRHWRLVHMGRQSRRDGQHMAGARRTDPSPGATISMQWR